MGCYGIVTGRSKCGFSTKKVCKRLDLRMLLNHAARGIARDIPDPLKG
jgi:hypothetical protein